MTDSEATLVRQCLAGDASSARELVERYQRAVFAVCARMLRHSHDTEDIVQEVFLRIFRSLHRWDPGRPLRPWILTIAVNRCRTALLQRRRVPIPVESTDERVTMPSQEHADVMQVIEEGLLELRPEYSTCFSLFYREELGIAEIGEIMDRPPGTIKTWLYRARRDMAEYLNRRGLAPEEYDELS